MKPQRSWRKLRVVVMIVFLTVLFALPSASSVSASPPPCTPAQILWYSAHPELTPPPECAPYFMSRSNTTGTGTQNTQPVPEDNPREPPPSTGPIPVGSEGGTFKLGDCIQVTIPRGLLPPGSTVTLTRYAQNSIPLGAAGIAFYGPGDLRVGVLIKDANGNTIQSVPEPGISVMFCTDENVAKQLPADQQYIRTWNGKDWIDEPTGQAGEIWVGLYSTKPVSETRKCNHDALADAEQRVADMENKVDQAQHAVGNAQTEWFFLRDDYLEAKTKATLAHNRAEDAARLAEVATRYAETVIQLAKDKPGSPELAQNMERARLRAEMASGRALEAVNEGTGSLQGLIEIDGKLTGLIQYEVPAGEPNPYTSDQYVKAAQELIALVGRTAQIAQQAADDLAKKEEEAFAKSEAARAAYQKAKDNLAAAKADLAKARAEWRKLRVACEGVD